MALEPIKPSVQKIVENIMKQKIAEDKKAIKEAMLIVLIISAAFILTCYIAAHR